MKLLRWLLDLCLFLYNLLKNLFHQGYKLPDKITFPDVLIHPSGTPLQLVSNKLFITFNEYVTPEEQEKIINELGFKPESPNPQFNNQSINQGGYQKWATSSNLLSNSDIAEIYKKYPRKVIALSPVYYLSDSQASPASLNDNRLLSISSRSLLISEVAFSRIKQYEGNEKFNLKELNLKEVPFMSRLLKEYRYFVIENPAVSNIYEIAESLKKIFPSEYIIFENIPYLLPLHTTDGTSGVSITQDHLDHVKATAAWEHINEWLTGNTARSLTKTLVAVVDTGCDTKHKDLSNVLQGVTIFSDNGSPAQEIKPNGLPNKYQFPNYHGTCCSGLIGAQHNDTGVKGIAMSSAILPIRIINYSDVEVLAAINYASDYSDGVAYAQTRVINLSLGVSSVWNQTLIDSGIQSAVNTKNCCIVASAGNAGLATLSYPAAHPDVIACGAVEMLTTTADDMYSRASFAGGGSSNYGTYTHTSGIFNGKTTGLWISAPGINIKTTTLDKTKIPSPVSFEAYTELGQNPPFFEGTSAATPIVAGLIALLLNVQPDLSPTELREILARSADPLPSFVVTSLLFEHKIAELVWHPEYGYGIINCLNAVKQVIPIV